MDGIWPWGWVARAGDHDRAEQAARSITDPDTQADALAGVAEAVARAGDHDRAEQVARSITDPDVQARALASVASVAGPTRARSFMAAALAVGRWTIPLKELARIDPGPLTAFADELARLGAHQTRPDNGPLSGTSSRRIPVGQAV